MSAIRTIDVTGLEARRAASEPLTIVDVRNDWELEICRLDEALHIPLQTLPAAVETLPKNRLLVILCHHGARSAQAVLWLQAQGFENAINLEGGIDAWAREIDPRMRRY